jgi:hypothetical protein
MVSKYWISQTGTPLDIYAGFENNFKKWNRTANFCTFSKKEADMGLKVDVFGISL